jgi:hypothetical protein
MLKIHFLMIKQQSNKNNENRIVINWEGFWSGCGAVSGITGLPGPPLNGTGGGRGWGGILKREALVMVLLERSTGRR